MIETLVDELFDDDNEFQKIKFLPGLNHIIQTLRDNLVPAADNLRIIGMEKDKLIRDEINQFQEALDGIINEALNNTNDRLIEWEKTFKHAARAYKNAINDFEIHHHHGNFDIANRHNNNNDAHLHDPIVSSTMEGLKVLINDVDKFESWALSTELTTHETVEAMLDVYDTAMVELKGAKVANHEGYFRAAESFEAVFSENLTKLSKYIEKDMEIFF